MAQQEQTRWTASIANATLPEESANRQIEGVLFRPLVRREDPRGWLVELFRADELPSGGQPLMAYVSETLPGAIRGPHEHVEQTDLFAFFGPGDFELFLWDNRAESPSHGVRLKVAVGGSNPQAVYVPPGVVHAYRNVSQQPGLVFNAPNQLYGGRNRSGPLDEIRYERRTDHPFQLD